VSEVKHPRYRPERFVIRSSCQAALLSRAAARRAISMNQGSCQQVAGVEELRSSPRRVDLTRMLSQVFQTRAGACAPRFHTSGDDSSGPALAARYGVEGETPCCTMHSCSS
jgi:hypothetical protein